MQENFQKWPWYRRSQLLSSWSYTQVQRSNTLPPSRIILIESKPPKTYWRIQCSDKYTIMKINNHFNTNWLILTIRTPLGDTNIPLPMIDPTMTVTPFNKVILAFNSTLSSPFFEASFISISSIFATCETGEYSSDFRGILVLDLL